MKLKFMLLIGIIYFWSCDDNSTGTIKESESYNFMLKINNESNEPLAGLKFRVKYVLKESFLNRMSNSQPLPNIAFDISDTSYNNLSIYNLDDELLVSLVDTILNPGRGNVSFNCYKCDSYIAGLDIFKYELTSTNHLTGDSLFNDSKYMVLFYGMIDAIHLEIAGITDNNGEFHSIKKLWFPHLYQLPEIKRTDGNGDSLGFFEIKDMVSDTVEIRVEKDSSLYIFKHQIIDGHNEINIVIPTALQGENLVQDSDRAPILDFGYSFEDSSDTTGPVKNTFFPPTSFRLYQSYPNPTN